MLYLPSFLSNRYQLYVSGHPEAAFWLQTTPNLVWDDYHKKYFLGRRMAKNMWEGRICTWKCIHPTMLNFINNPIAFKNKENMWCHFWNLDVLSSTIVPYRPMLLM